MTNAVLAKDNIGIAEWMEDGDHVVIVDRGFRNAVEPLKAKGFEVKTPIVTQGKQDSVQDANHSRLVTKVRWVVEAYHGRFKKWKFFDNRQGTWAIPDLAAYLKILTAAINALRPLLLDTTKDTAWHQDVANAMLDLSTHCKPCGDQGGKRFPLQSRPLGLRKRKFRSSKRR